MRLLLHRQNARRRVAAMPKSRRRLMSIFSHTNDSITRCKSRILAAFDYFLVNDFREAYSDSQSL